jgi:adiponectin receptor
MCLVLFMVPGFQKPKYRPLRGSVFVLCGLMSCFPIFHLEFYTEPKYIKDFKTYPWAFGGSLYIIGAVLYMLKIPERFKPGKFDIVVRALEITTI